MAFVQLNPHRGGMNTSLFRAGGRTKSWYSLEELLPFEVCPHAQFVSIHRSICFFSYSEVDMIWNFRWLCSVLEHSTAWGLEHRTEVLQDRKFPGHHSIMYGRYGAVQLIRPSGMGCRQRHAVGKLECCFMDLAKPMPEVSTEYIFKTWIRAGPSEEHV